MWSAQQTICLKILALPNHKQSELRGPLRVFQSDLALCFDLCWQPVLRSPSE